MCEIARKTLDYKEFATKHSNPIGAPPIHPKSPPPKVITLCSKCLSEIGQGKPHQCYKTQKRENISEFVRSSSTKTTGQVTATGLKKVADEEGVSTRGGTVALSTGGNPLSVQIGVPKKIQPKSAHFSHENLKMLQAANNLSDRSLL